ncbi:hypothetical protein HYFRA_00009732 [Hymenoscyphus fraxineus]|uniref:Uncharacterized protein n=1 Tax=Hymenoscyphus fraxineus TaxID=746836 RepID=A0A9N9PR02_9HELO|nr:hypothetical protein HYFRA_00009732 [Hymenoscyphus fraxineus]
MPEANLTHPNPNPEPNTSKNDKKEEKPITDVVKDKKGESKDKYKMDGKKFEEFMWKYI